MKREVSDVDLNPRCPIEMERGISDEDRGLIFFRWHKKGYDSGVD